MNKMPSFLREDEKREKEWAHLTEGLNGNEKLALEAMLENTRNFIMTEDSDTGNVSKFTTYGFPLIRRVFPNLIANELVSVQPITMPSAMVFYLDFNYGTAIRDTEVGDNIYGDFNPYYAGGMIRNYLLGTGDGAETVFTVSDDRMVPVLADSATVYVDGESVAFTLTDAATGEFTLDSAAADGAAVTVSYQLSTPTEGGDDIPEVDFNMTSSTVEAETKKLKAKWTIESQQDMIAYHGVNAETELLAVLGDEIRREIDRMIINDLYNIAGAGNVTWTADVPAEYNGSEREYRMTLYDAILDANNLIYKKRFRNANWIVADPDTCTRLEKLDGFAEVKGDWSGGAGMGLEKFGILNNRFQVYKDPMAQANTLLLGYKGNSMFETGYIYAPYIPLYTSPTFLDPNTMKNVRAVMSRFARKPIIKEMYSTVTIEV